jgi:hypothetical protein
VRETVHPDLEAAIVELSEQAGIEVVVPGAEVERRPESVFLLEIGQLERSSSTIVAFDVMGEDDRSPTAAGPEPDELTFAPAGRA